MKVLLITMAILFIALSSCYFESAMAGPIAPIVVCKGLCERKCRVRCAKTGIRFRCEKYCLICCKECGCVPSGSYGNKDQCPCYRDKRTSGSIKKHRCP